MASAQPMAVVERLLGDDYVRDQIGEAAGAVRDAYRRARKLPAGKAVVDQRVYDRVRKAAAGLAGASRRALGQPPPQPPRRHPPPAGGVPLAPRALVLSAAQAGPRPRAGGG